MKVTHIKEQEPEKLAALLARYSRSNKGWQGILAEHGDKSPEVIMSFVDYGHASIGGLTGGIPIAMDGISRLLACKLFEFAQMADGQESSTRYIAESGDNFMSADELGLPERLREKWEAYQKLGMQCYRDAVSHYGAQNISPAKIMTGKEVRLARNKALDVARNLLPLATKTNVAIVTTARIWADILVQLRSLRWSEAEKLAGRIHNQLYDAGITYPLKHAFPDRAALAEQHELLCCLPRDITRNCAVSQAVDVEVVTSHKLTMEDWDSATNRMTTRYSRPGLALKQQTVTFRVTGIAVAELRDLMRHRTGFRYSSWLPVGLDIPCDWEEIVPARSELLEAAEKCIEAFSFRTTLPECPDNMRITTILREAHVAMLHELAQLPAAETGFQAYGYLLGTQLDKFEHTQQGDKFFYEVNLRTGEGSHAAYRSIMERVFHRYLMVNGLRAAYTRRF